MSVECRTIPPCRPCGDAECERPECNPGKAATEPQRVIDIVTDRGVPFRVAYGKRPYTTGELSKFPVVAFYDTRCTVASPLHAHGQFVADYSVETLLERQNGWPLALYGNDPSWVIDAGSMALVRMWLIHIFTS